MHVTGGQRERAARRMRALAACAAGLVLAAGTAGGQGAPLGDDVVPGPPIVDPLAPTPPAFDSNCVVSVLNRVARVRADGTWVLGNLPSNFGPVRARATCIFDGQSLVATSEVFEPTAGGVYDVEDLRFDRFAPTPSALVLASVATQLFAVGETAAVEVRALFPDGTDRDVTDEPATAYTSSNPAIASVDGAGTVTAHASGVVVITVVHEGLSGFLSIAVVLASEDMDGDGIPDDVELTSGLDPNDPVDAFEDPDGDGLGSGDELLVHGTDPFAADTDDDGLTDGEEVTPGSDGFVTSPLLVDTDGDGVRDGLEIATGSDPTDPASLNLSLALASIEASPAFFLLTVNTLVGEASQQLSVVGHLVDGTSIDLTSTQLGTGYTSDNLASCTLGADGTVFAAADGACSIDIANGGFTTSVEGLVRSFAPIPLGFVALPGFANGVALAGGRAYVAAGSAGLQVVDVSDRSSPSLAGSAPSPGNANDVAVVGDRAYLADGAAGLVVYDLADPLAPVPIGAFDTAGVAADVAVRAGRALVADGAAGAHLFDVSGAGDPVLLGSAATAADATGVDFSPDGRYAAVALGGAGLAVVDLSVPAAMGVVATLSTGGEARDLRWVGEFAFVADASNSLVPVDLGDPLLPAVGVPVPTAQGGRLNDVAAVGRFALGADFAFVNGVPVFDLRVPGSPVAAGFVDFSSFRDDNGQAIAADASYVYLTAAAGVLTPNGSSGDTRLYIGQYLALEDGAGQAPLVAIVEPVDGASYLEGARVMVEVDAQDDVAVVAVDLLVDGSVAASDAAEPFQFDFEVPLGAGSVALGARAIDVGGNVGTAPSIELTVLPDPRTTAEGTVQDADGLPVENADVACLGETGLSDADGRFSIPDVPTSQGPVTCTASFPTPGGTAAGTSAPAPPVAGGITDVGVVLALENAPTIVEAGWTLTRAVRFADPRGAHYNPVDGLLYVARRVAAPDGIYRIEADGSATPITGADRPASVLIDPSDGDIFHSEDFGGAIFRTPFGGTGRATWVSGIHSGDDDPVGMAIAPPDYLGGALQPGEAVFVDRGNSGLDEIWRFSTATAQGETALHSDNGTLIDAVDVTVTSDAIYVVDAAGSLAGRIYRVEVGGVLQLVATDEPILDPVGVVADPQSGDLLVYDAFDSRIVRVDPQTGAVSDLATGLTAAGAAWAGVDMTPDGSQLFITDTGGNAIFTLSR